jgi:hypothetical protein
MKTSTAEKTVICRKTGCGRSFTGKHAQQAETTHYHRVHSGRIVVPREGYKLRSKRRSAKKAKLALSRFSLRNGKASVRLTTQDGSLDGRSKEARLQKLQRTAYQESVQFCPNCLTDLSATARAIVKSGQTHLKVNGCPKCGCNVKAVAEELIATKH